MSFEENKNGFRIVFLKLCRAEGAYMQILYPQLLRTRDIVEAPLYSVKTLIRVPPVNKTSLTGNILFLGNKLISHST
jgi:hypothetical protein